MERKYEPLASQSLLLRSFGSQTPQNVGDQPRQPVARSRSSVPLMRSRVVRAAADEREVLLAVAAPRRGGCS